VTRDEARVVGAAEIPWDPHEYSGRVCRACGVPRVFRRARINHSLQFMLSLGTLGVWLPVWGIVILLRKIRPWTCTACGSRQHRN
jgi:hypothetical protein